MRRMSRKLSGLTQQLRQQGRKPRLCTRSCSSSSSSFDLKATLEAPSKLLLTPGPLSTTMTVKQAMMHDFGSRDSSFIELVKSVRSDILRIGKMNESEWTAILMQGSGSFSVESTIQTAVPREGGSVLIVSNGAYADRAGKQCERAGINYQVLRFTEDTLPDLTAIDDALKEKSFSHLFMVHSETTSGLVNPIQEVSTLARQNGARVMIDAMSSFGGIPMDDCTLANIDYLVTSANKCLQGVPGFGIILARLSELDQCKGNARSLVLDAYQQWLGLEKDGQFRFTPPTHTICALKQAMIELDREGGVEHRYRRYRDNQRIVCEGLTKIGFELYLDPALCGPIITSFRYPTKNANWDFDVFYSKLASKDLLIYPGKVTNADCFRIGHIGHVTRDDSLRLVEAVKEVCNEMNLFNPHTSSKL